MQTIKNTPANWLAHTPVPPTRQVPAIEIDDQIQQLLGKPHRGQPASTTCVSVDTPMAIAQRPFHPGNVRRFILRTHGQIDWNLFGVVTAVRNRSTGETTIINGQHRISLVKTLDPAIQDVPAHIIDEDDEIYVAKLFGYMNGGAAVSVTREERLWADIVAQEKSALVIESALVQAGLACGIVNAYDADGNPNIQVNVAGFEKCLALGLDHTLRAVSLIRSAWPTARKFDQQLLGLVKFLSIAEYQDLSEPKRVISQRFDTWFTTVLPQLISIEGFKFRVNRNWAPNWETAIAFGIAKKFRHWLGVRGYPQIGLTTLNDIRRRSRDESFDDIEE